MSLKTILVSCVRGGILTRMKGLLNLFVILLRFITQVFEDFGARWWRGTEGPSNNCNPFPSSIISFFSLLFPEEFYSFYCHIPPTPLRSVGLPLCPQSGDQSCIFIPWPVISHQYLQFSLPRVHLLPMLLFSLSVWSHHVLPDDSAAKRNG